MALKPHTNTAFCVFAERDDSAGVSGLDPRDGGAERYGHVVHADGGLHEPAGVRRGRGRHRAHGGNRL